MKTKWTQGLTGKDKDNFEQAVYNSKYVLDKLKEICYNIIEESRKATKADYDSPSWAFKQADKLGYERALIEIINLISLDPKEP